MLYICIRCELKLYITNYQQQIKTTGTLTEEELAANGIKRLPQTLGEAIQCTREDKQLLAILNDGFKSENLVRAHLAARDSEWNFYKDMEFEKQVEMLYARY